MTLSKAICPKCGAEIFVNASDDATICQLCGAPFITAKAIAAYSASHDTAVDASDTFPEPYRITIERKRNPVISNDITFIVIKDGRPRPLPDDGIMVLETDKKRFEIPVFITDNARKKFEGVLTGIADGKDIYITWDANRDSKTLGEIVSTTNDTVTFVERKGATKW